MQGLISQLGAYANEVFFMISGFFLIESAARQHGQAGYWRRQAKKTGALAPFIGAIKRKLGSNRFCLYALGNRLDPTNGYRAIQKDVFPIGIPFQSDTQLKQPYNIAISFHLFKLARESIRA